ncbi:pseudouridine synthase [Methyloceanibacter methanicus]|uniref:tRNA pseudouridine synthase B n=1 Tax=Methyloceanibacter methanicus TaxID=1774968 RepID=A0A1E3W262_9HYPH|nr:tRNA pseudouridine(55) synthase TruB [Methyloceanibacter methanicus]ODR99894.1 pseudouridine synthase [Methyloceanibacter methanicus]
MGRRRKGQAVNGWLVLDKPAGLTSTKAVGRTRWLFDAQKAGHAGTLDPLATGILPIAFGEATKTVPYAVEGAKTYRFTVRFGAETDTDDAEGTVTATSAKRPTRAEIEAVLPQFVGEISQVPPRFSALKVDGARAYDLARDKEDFELAPRIVSIDRLAVIDLPDPETCVLEADCGKGTYVRALARDLGRTLQCRGHIAALRRTRVGDFVEDEAVALDAVEQAAEEGRETLLALLQPVDKALSDLPALSVTPTDASRLRQGRSVLLRGRDAPIVTGPVYAVSRGRLVAIGEVEQGEFHPTRVFNLPD